MATKSLFVLVHILAICLVVITYAETDANTAENDDPTHVEQEKLEYAKGSLCGYCEYCEFCSLCDTDCPCTVSRSKPNCHMCKYCKYCYLCSGVCDTVCQPGGVIDKVSSTIFQALPSHNTEEINEDLESVQGWLDHNKDEL